MRAAAARACRSFAQRRPGPVCAPRTAARLRAAELAAAVAAAAVAVVAAAVWQDSSRRMDDGEGYEMPLRAQWCAPGTRRGARDGDPVWLG